MELIRRVVFGGCHLRSTLRTYKSTCTLKARNRLLRGTFRIHQKAELPPYHQNIRSAFCLKLGSGKRNNPSRARWDAKAGAFGPLNINRTSSLEPPHRHHHRHLVVAVFEMKLHFVWMENNWKLIPDQSRVEPVNFSSHPHACERTSRSSWQSLAAWEAPELKSADFLIYVAILLYAFPFVCLPFLCWSPLLLVGGCWKVGRKKGSTSKRDGGEEPRTGERSTHIYRFSFRLYTLPRCPQKHKARSLRLYQHGAMLLSMGMMLTLNGENEKTTKLCACVRGRKENKKRRRNYVLKFLYVELRWWVERVEGFVVREKTLGGCQSR